MQRVLHANGLFRQLRAVQRNARAGKGPVPLYLVNVQGAFRPATAASLLLLVVAFLFFRRKADEKLESGREPASVYTMLSVLLFAAVTVELMTVVILSGDSLLLRQSFLMGCLIDLLAIMACTEGLHRLKIIETDGQ